MKYGSSVCFKSTGLNWYPHVMHISTGGKMEKMHEKCMQNGGKAENRKCGFEEDDIIGLTAEMYINLYSIII